MSSYVVMANTEKPKWTTVLFHSARLNKYSGPTESYMSLTMDNEKSIRNLTPHKQNDKGVDKPTSECFWKTLHCDTNVISIINFEPNDNPVDVGSRAECPTALVALLGTSSAHLESRTLLAAEGKGGQTWGILICPGKVFSKAIVRDTVCSFLRKTFNYSLCFHEVNIDIPRALQLTSRVLGAVVDMVPSSGLKYRRSIVEAIVQSQMVDNGYQGVALIDSTTTTVLRRGSLDKKPFGQPRMPCPRSHEGKECSCVLIRVTKTAILANYEIWWKCKDHQLFVQRAPGGLVRWYEIGLREHIAEYDVFFEPPEESQ